jgi:D-alanyl-D-alanine carboxypeptidase
MVPGEPMVDTTDWNPSWGWTAGAAISTARDMAIWAKALGSGRLLTPQMQHQRLRWMPTNGTVPYGTGVGRYGLGIADFGGLIGHNGEIPGFENFAAYQPDERATVVVLTNVLQSPDPSQPGGNLPADTLAYTIANGI